METILTSLRSELSTIADEKTRKQGEKFFKEEVSMYGIKSAQVTAISKKYYQKIKNLEKNEIFTLCEELWKSGIMEECMIACQWSEKQSKYFVEEDIELFERWISKYVSNWATCDTLCNHTVGSIVTMYPKLTLYMKQWSKSPNRWMRRASAVTFIIPARKGLFLDDIFEIAQTLLIDTDDLVQKGYGWMLKAASQAYQQEVFEFIMKNKKEMPRTALRYAIEKMPEDLRKKAMAK